MILLKIEKKNVHFQSNLWFFGNLSTDAFGYVFMVYGHRIKFHDWNGIGWVEISFITFFFHFLINYFILIFLNLVAPFNRSVASHLSGFKCIRHSVCDLRTWSTCYKYIRRHWHNNRTIKNCYQQLWFILKSPLR